MPAKRSVTLIAVAIALAGSSVLAACGAPSGGPKAAPTPSTPAAPKPVSAEGSVVPIAQAKLGFQTAGRVKSILPVGREVRAGDVLAQLDTKELDAALKAAQDDLAVSRAQETQTREATQPEQLAAAANVRASRAKLAEVTGGPRQADRSAAEAAVEQASARLQDAVSKQQEVASQPKPADVEAAKSVLEKSQRDAEAAQARLALIERGAIPEDVTGAKSAVDRANADLTSARVALKALQSGPSAADVAGAQAALDEAKTKLAQLRDAPRATPQDLDNAKLDVQQARVSLDKAIADAGNKNLVGDGSDGRPMTHAQAEAAIKQAQIQVTQAQNRYDKLAATAPTAWDLRLAEETVASAQAAYDRATKPATAEDLAKAQAQVASAEAALTGAQAKLQQTQRGPEQADLVAARGTLAAAQAGVPSAQAKLDQVLAGPSDEERRAADAAVISAQAEVQSAQSKLIQLLAGPTAAEREQAESAVVSAAANEAQTKRGPSAATLELAATRTKRSETAVEQAQVALDKATLRAPFDGVVTKIDVKAGEYAAPGATAVTVADLTMLQIETKDLDEAAVARVQEGQEVTVTVGALGRKALSGTLIDLARQPTINASGDVFYTATIALPQRDPALRWGMTVKVEFR